MAFENKTPRIWAAVGGVFAVVGVILNEKNLIKCYD